MPSRRCVAWSTPEPFPGGRAEFVEVDLGTSRLEARGVAIGGVPLPYRLDYELETTDAFATERLAVSVRADGWSRALEMRRRPSGQWEANWREQGAPSAAVPAPRADLAELAGALDVDVSLSPLFNTMPVLRHGLLRAGGPIDFVMAWISVPDLCVHRSAQRYAFVRVDGDDRSVVRFESLSGDGFAAEITYDAAGLVLDYPGIGARLR